MQTWGCVSLFSIKRPWRSISKILDDCKGLFPTLGWRHLVSYSTCVFTDCKWGNKWPTVPSFFWNVLITRWALHSLIVCSSESCSVREKFSRTSVCERSYHVQVTNVVKTLDLFTDPCSETVHACCDFSMLASLVGMCVLFGDNQSFTKDGFSTCTESVVTYFQIISPIFTAIDSLFKKLCSSDGCLFEQMGRKFRVYSQAYCGVKENTFTTNFDSPMREKSSTSPTFKPCAIENSFHPPRNCTLFPLPFTLTLSFTTTKLDPGPRRNTLAWNLSPCARTKWDGNSWQHYSANQHFISPICVELTGLIRFRITIVVHTIRKSKIRNCTTYAQLANCR